MLRRVLLEQGILTFLALGHVLGNQDKVKTMLYEMSDDDLYTFAKTGLSLLAAIPDDCGLEEVPSWFNHPSHWLLCGPTRASQSVRKTDCNCHRQGWLPFPNGGGIDSGGSE